MVCYYTTVHYRRSPIPIYTLLRYTKAAFGGQTCRGEHLDAGIQRPIRAQTPRKFVKRFQAFVAAAFLVAGKALGIAIDDTIFLAIPHHRGSKPTNREKKYGDQDHFFH